LAKPERAKANEPQLYALSPEVYQRPANHDAANRLTAR
jgi:hypothetical protein